MTTTCFRWACHKAPVLLDSPCKLSWEFVMSAAVELPTLHRLTE